MDRTAISKLIRGEAAALLRELGFRNSQGLTFWRYEERQVAILRFQFLDRACAERWRWLDCSYTFGWGKFLIDVPEPFSVTVDRAGRLRPRLDQLHMVRSARRPGEWESGVAAETFVINRSPSSAVTAIQETLHILSTETRAWLQRYDSVPAIVEAFHLSDTELRAHDPYLFPRGSAGSYVRHRMLAYLLMAERRYDEALREVDGMHRAVLDCVVSDLSWKNRQIDEIRQIEASARGSLAASV